MVDIGAFVGNDVEAEWHTIPGTEAEVKIRVLKPKQQRAFARACTKRKVKRGVAFQDVDNEKLNRLLLDYCVIDWRKIEENGQPVECNAENKRRLDDNWSAFSNLWNEVVGEEDQVKIDLDNAETENLGDGQSST